MSGLHDSQVVDVGWFGGGHAAVTVALTALKNLFHMVIKKQLSL